MCIRDRFQGDVVKLLVNGEQQATGAVTSLGCAIHARSVIIYSSFRDFPGVDYYRTPGRYFSKCIRSDSALPDHALYRNAVKVKHWWLLSRYSLTH